ncbi:MAG TPA: DUF3857 domain-containing protein, partial [Flavisolibacter sp.]|nr:DUF3857 domain-containing protein [Flavisolibacter sp.]
RKSIFTTKANSVFSIVSFALPNVKAGSIIEYKYTSVCKHYGGLKDWKFQKDIPVLFSTYKLYVIPNHEFAYTVYKNSFMQTDVKTDPGVVTFAMKNIPGLRDEAYSTSYEDYIQRVTFQLSGYSNYMGTKKVNTTWKDLSKDLFEDPDFGGALNKDLSNTADLKANCDKLSSVEEKIKLIYNYVRSSMNWDHIYSLYCDNGIKSAWEKKKGHSADINLVLINLLKANGLDVYPLLVSEREDGKVDTTYPYLKQFMNVVAYVEAGGKSFILDGIDRITPTGTTPFKLLNTKGYIVDKKKGRFITITDNGLKDKNIINLLVNVDPSGNLSGQSAIYNFDYAKVYKVNAYNNIVDKYRDAYMEKYASMKIDSFQISGLDNDSLPLTESFLLTAPVNKSGDYYLLNYNLFTGLEKNPFVSEHRFTNIDFGCQHSTLLNAYFTIPANFDIESLPKSILLRTPDNSISMSRTIEKQERNIRLLIKMDIVKTEFQADEYDMIQGFYKKVFETLNEPIVLKSK